MEHSLFQQFVLAGGPIMFALVPSAIMATVYAVQGFINLRAFRTCPKDFARRMWEARHDPGKWKDILKQGEAEHSLARIVGRSYAAIAAMPDERPIALLRSQIGDEIDRLLYQNSQLGVLYRLTPLLGLVGTVIGMIRAFMEFSLSSQPKIENLAAGVMTALIATAWGISIACFSLFFLSIHQRRVLHLENFGFIEEGELALHAMTGHPIGASLETVEKRGLSG